MKKVIWIFLGILAVGFLAYCFFPIIFFNESTSHQTEPWRIFLTDRNGVVITDKMKEHGYHKPVFINSDAEFIQALIKIEDKSYYDHFWISVISKLRAIRDNISGKRSSWGSTITEQYLKNKYFTSVNRSYLQKVREAVLALYLSLARSKDDILESYYNSVYFWNNLYGVWSAIEVYFWKDDIRTLTQEEVTLLLSLIHNPGIQSLDEAYFQSYFEQTKQRLWYSFERSYFWKLNKKKNLDRFPFVTNDANKLGLWTNMQVSIDAELQQYAKNIIESTLSELKDKNVTNAAAFAIQPVTGQVLLYQWSRNFHSRHTDGQVNVINSPRQPGSTMKPFLYLQALEAGAEPDSLLLDIESEYNSFQEWKTYISENYSLKEYGLARLKKALWNSFNNATVRLARELWLTKVYNYYISYGFDLPESPEHYGYSLVLWNPNITLWDLVHSYTRLLPDEKSKEKFLLYQILSDPDNRDISFWVNSILNTSIPQAVKTGTSSEFRDNLILSYHPDFILWVWVGNNDNSSMQWVTWISWAGYIWHHIIEKAIELGYIQEREILVPEGISEISYCLDKGCYRKENSFARDDTLYFSRLIDTIYDKRDIFEQLSLFEIEKLEALGFRIQE